MGRALRVEADGGSRGNPGIAGYGALVRDVDSGDLLVELAAPLGTASNNVAEYQGMLAGLAAAQRISADAEVLVAMDSKLVVEQMSGRWKIKHPDMRELALQGRDLVAAMSAFHLVTPRRRSRRVQPHRHGRHIDLRATLRAARRTGGDPVRTLRRSRRLRPRPGLS